MFFKYQQTNGILRYFFTKKKNLYDEIVTYNSANNHASLKTAFDFKSDTFWVPEYNSAQSETWMSFCLNFYMVKLTYYEITTSNGGNRPTNWSFSVSKDGINYSNEKIEEHPMEKGEIYPVEYQTTESFRCFKYSHHGLTSQNEPRSDITQIELFGTLVDLKACTIPQQSINIKSLNLYFLFMIYSYKE